MDEQGERVKFDLECLSYSLPSNGQWKVLADTLKELERLGCVPLTPDGKRAGNVALRVGEGLIVSRSGRDAMELGPEDFVTVVNFDRRHWKAQYVCSSEGVKPTSDTPLYWTALIEIPQGMKWKEKPLAALHGHALHTEEAAIKLSIPISPIETEFSTPDDQAALVELLCKHPYPEHKAYIRKGHGFFILDSSAQETLQLAADLVEKGRRYSLL